MKQSDPKQIALSGPSGFLGTRVVQAIMDVHSWRRAHGLEPGELLLLSASPGKLMSKLTDQYGAERMVSVRASRVDYYRQHNVDLWHDQLGSLGLGGNNSVYVNLAGVAGPIPGRPEAMMAVNYKAPIAAARACQELRFGHFIQSSTQATKAERGGQVPYSQWKGMADFSLARLEKLPVSIFTLGLLYCKNQRILGQRGDNLNLADLTMLPLTPIMGDGSAPMQPLEVLDAAERVSFLALTDPSKRPMQSLVDLGSALALADPWMRVSASRMATLRVYDAVGPDTMGMLEMLEHFARINNNPRFRPVFVDYRNLERVLNVASLGNLNRQFVSLLRSEQDGLRAPVIGSPAVFESLLGPAAKLTSLPSIQPGHGMGRQFPFRSMYNWVLKNPRAIIPGIALNFEILANYFLGASFVKRIRTSSLWHRTKVVLTTVYIAALVILGIEIGSEVAVHLPK